MDTYRYRFGAREGKPRSIENPEITEPHTICYSVLRGTNGCKLEPLDVLGVPAATNCCQTISAQAMQSA